MMFPIAIGIRPKSKNDSNVIRDAVNLLLVFLNFDSRNFFRIFQPDLYHFSILLKMIKVTIAIILYVMRFGHL